jgi:RNA polymerase sigma factor (sigma-70 family)
MSPGLVMVVTSRGDIPPPDWDAVEYVVPPDLKLLTRLCVSIDRAGTAADDASLVRRAKAGDHPAFDVLVDRHTPGLYRAVRRLASDRGEAEAIVQEAWLKAWRALGRCDERRPLAPWLARIAVNVARDRWRKDRTIDFADLGASVEDLRAQDPGPELKLERRLALERLGRGVERLRPEQRLVIALRYDAQMSYADMAEALGIPVNTVRTHLHRAKGALREWMEAEGDGLDG